MTYVRSFTSGFLAAAALATTLFACGEDSTSSATVSAIDLSPSPCTISRGDSRQLGAEATLPDGTKRNISADPTVTWTTDNKDTATVNPSGIVVGVSAGVTKITAAYQGATGSINCTVAP